MFNWVFWLNFSRDTQGDQVNSAWPSFHG